MLLANNSPSCFQAFSTSTQTKQRRSCRKCDHRCRAADEHTSQTLTGVTSFPAALLAAGLMAVTDAGHASAEAAGNSSMMDQIHFYQAEAEAEKQSYNDSRQRPETPAELLEAASIQLQKVETLIGIGQYESARQQLRQGAASTIRLDLRAYDRTHTKPDTPQAGKAIVHQVEVLDLALKKSKPTDECRQLVQQIRRDISDILASP